MHECFFPWSCKVVHIGASVWNRKVGAYTSNFSFIKPWVASGCNMLQYVAIVPISQLASPPIYEWLIWKSISSCCRFEKNSSMLRRSTGSTWCAAPLTRGRRRSWLPMTQQLRWLSKARWSSQIFIILFCNSPIEHLQGEGFNKCEYPKMDGIWKNQLKSGYPYFRKPPRSLRPLRTRSFVAYAPHDPCWSLMWPVCLRIVVVAPNSNYTPIQLCWVSGTILFRQTYIHCLFAKFLCLLRRYSDFSSINPPKEKAIPCSFWKNHQKTPMLVMISLFFRLHTHLSWLQESKFYHIRWYWDTSPD